MHQLQSKALKYEEKLAGEMNTISRSFLLVFGCCRSFYITALHISISIPVQVSDWASLLGFPVAEEVGGNPVPLARDAGRIQDPRQRATQESKATRRHLSLGGINST